MCSAGPIGQSLGRLVVGLITFLIAAPLTFLLFAMGLVVAEFVMFPLATLAIAVVTALVGSWTAWRLAGEGMRTDLNRVVRRNLAWGIIPATVALVFPLQPLLVVPPVFLMGAVLVYTVVVTTALAFRYRHTVTSIGKPLAHSAGWLIVTGMAVVAGIFVASLLNLTGP